MSTHPRSEGPDEESSETPMPAWPEDPAEKALNAPRPMTVRAAIYVMIFGAVLAAGVSVFTLIQADREQLRGEFAKQLKQAGEKAGPEQIEGAITTMLVTLVVVGAVSAVLWLFSALMIHRRKRWARTMGMVLAAICLLVTFTQLPLLFPNLLAAVPVLVLLWTASAREWLGDSGGGRFRLFGGRT